MSDRAVIAYIVFPLVLVWMGWIIWMSFSLGEVGGKGITLTRADRPKAYWATMAFYGVMFCLMLGNFELALTGPGPTL